MKTFIVSFAFVLFVLLVIQGQAQDKKNIADEILKKEIKMDRTGNKEMRKAEAKNVSELSLKNFETHFGANSNVSWVRTDHFDEATFVYNNQKTTAFYDFEGNLEGTTTVVAFTDLPLNGQKTITKDYAGYTPEYVVLYDFKKNSGVQMLLFNSQFADSKNYFVQMSNGKKIIVLQVTPVGSVYFFKKVK